MPGNFPTMPEGSIHFVFGGRIFRPPRRFFPTHLSSSLGVDVCVCFFEKKLDVFERDRKK